MPLSCLDAHAHVTHKAKRKRGRSVHLRIVEVHELRVQPNRKWKCLRQHSKWAHATNQIAVFKRAAILRTDVIRVQGAGNTPADNGTVHCTVNRMWQQAQLQEPSVQVPKT